MVFSLIIEAAAELECLLIARHKMREWLTMHRLGAKAA